MMMIITSLIPINAQNRDSYNEIVALANELNDWRLSTNLSPLVYNSKLEAKAQSQLDYLLSLPEIPADIHRGTQGEYPRERSQLPQFAWEYYGFPDNVSVTEIAAIGSVSSAINFWQNSDIHARSVTNPAYREVGIALSELDANNTITVSSYRLKIFQKDTAYEHGLGIQVATCRTLSNVVSCGASQHFPLHVCFGHHLVLTFYWMVFRLVIVPPMSACVQLKSIISEIDNTNHLSSLPFQ